MAERAARSTMGDATRGGALTTKDIGKQTEGLPPKNQTLKTTYTVLGSAGLLLTAAKVVFRGQMLGLDFPGTAVTPELCRAQRVLGCALLPGVGAAFALRDAVDDNDLNSADALRLNIGLIAFGAGVARSLFQIPPGVVLDGKGQALVLVGSAVSIIAGCVGASSAIVSKHRTSENMLSDAGAALLSFVKPKNFASGLYGAFSVVFTLASVLTFKDPSTPQTATIPFVFTGVGASVLLELLMASGTLVAPFAALTLKAASDKGQLSTWRSKLLNSGLLGVAAGFGITIVEGMITTHTNNKGLLLRVGIWVVVGVTTGLNLFSKGKHE